MGETGLMPTTLTGLLLFVVLLLPGFAYLIGKERHGTERRLSPFRETVAIVAASVTSELAMFVIFAGIRALWPSGTPDVGALIRNGRDYLLGTHGHPGQYRLVSVWGISLLAAASLVAYLATKPKIRRPLENKPRLTRLIEPRPKLKRLVEKLNGPPYPHDSMVSAWWVLFERWPRGRDIQVACILDDGSAVRGKFGSFNNSADDSADRDLVLQEPIFYRPPGEKAREVLWDMSAVCCSARHIVSLFVTYSEREQQSAIPLQEPQVHETSAVSAEQSEAMPSSAASTQELTQA